MNDFKCSIEPCITPRHAAKILGVSVNTVKRYLRKKHLKGFKLPGGSWRTTESACKALLERSSNIK